MAASLRFLHAGQCRLDLAVTGVGSVPRPVQTTLEDASLIAFDRLMQAAIDREVDFVLLGGDTFRADDRSLRARLRIEQGLAKLAEAGIAVVANVGQLDSAAVWYDLSLPEEVTVLTDRHEDATIETADGTAIVHRVGERFDAPARCDLAIGLVTTGYATYEDDAEYGDFDYIGQAENVPHTTELTRGVVHDPGALTPATLDDDESIGATLVEMTRGGHLKTTPIALSPVRCRHEELTVDESTDIEALAEQMQERMLELRDEAGCELTLVRWTIDGEGPVRNDLTLDGTWDDLVELIDDERPRLHRLQNEAAESTQDEVSEMLAAELETWFDETEQSTDELVETVSQRTLRTRLADAADFVDERKRTLAEAAIACDGPELWARDAA